MICLPLLQHNELEREETQDTGDLTPLGNLFFMEWFCLCYLRGKIWKQSLCSTSVSLPWTCPYSLTQHLVPGGQYSPQIWLHSGTFYLRPWGQRWGHTCFSGSWRMLVTGTCYCYGSPCAHAEGRTQSDSTCEAFYHAGSVISKGSRIFLTKPVLPTPQK